MSQPRRVRRTAAQWRDIVEQFHVSELSETKFCEQHDLGLVSFRKWRCKYATKKATTKPTRRGFTSVDVRTTEQQVTGNHTGIQIHLGSQVRIDCQSQPIEVIAQLALAVHHGR